MNRWIIDTEELISDLEDRDNGNQSIRTEKKKENFKNWEQFKSSLRQHYQWDNIINIHIIGFTEGKGGILKCIWWDYW